MKNIQCGDWIHAHWDDLEDYICDNLDEVRTHYPLFFRWWLDAHENYLESMTEEELAVWADKQEQRINKWAQEHPEEDAILCSEERKKRMWNRIQRQLKD